MTPGLWIKSIREIAPMTLLFAVGFWGIESALAYILPTFQEHLLGEVMQIPLIQNMIRSLVGADMGADTSFASFSSIAWVHPVALATLWAEVIVLGTRMPAGELDYGTMDISLSFPVGRWHWYLVESCTGLVLAIVLSISAGVLGFAVGSLSMAPDERIPLMTLIRIAVNLLFLCWAVGGVTWLISSLSRQRGRAVGLAFAIVVGSFLFNFVAQHWQPAKDLSFLSILHYYQPLMIVRSGDWPLENLLILGSIGFVLWFLGGLAFSRRDLYAA